MNWLAVEHCLTRQHVSSRDICNKLFCVLFTTVTSFSNTFLLEKKCDDITFNCVDLLKFVKVKEMSWVHCNNCIDLPVKGRDNFLLTSCGKEKKCIICNQNCDVTEINRNLESSVLKYFLKPQDIVKSQMRDLSQVMEFQEFHRNSLVSHCRKLVSMHVIKNFQMVNEKMKVESQKFISLRSLKESLLENHRLKKEIESLKNEVALKSDFVYNKIATPSLNTSGEINHLGKSLYVRSSSPVVSQSSGRVQSTLGKRIALPCIPVVNSCLSSVESQSLTTPDILNVENSTVSKKSYSRRTDSTQNRIPGTLTSENQSSSILCENNQSRRSGLDSQYLHSVADSLKLPFPMQSIGNCQLWSRKAPRFKPSGRTL
ncbi:hypothetical protein Tsp_07939 [Trichinella spiralis]|uniref:hypothetical protein n=1 Tax=Trichinella spiralis TaxID=6334 RepID=UPI0001EFD6E6|nr:hypothetical protein Tsp_07939 [Trichinella spiralis]